MKAAVCTKYGPPEVIKIQEVEKPSPKENEVLIKVYATTCHIGDVRVRSFDVPLLHMIPFRLFLGITKPKQGILGMELSGVVEETGSHVKRFKKGDEVFATSGFKFGAHAEYICIAEDSKDIDKGFVVLKPNNMSHEEAAAGTTTGGMTALLLLRKANIQKGQKVMIYGASGSVGVFAVQLAKVLYGAEVTAVDSKEKIELMKSLGADVVVDYKDEDVTKNGTQYDLILDLVGGHTIADFKLALAPKGKYFLVGSTLSHIFKILFWGSLISLTTSKKMQVIGINPNKGLKEIAEIIDTGKIKTVIDKTFTLDETPKAFTYMTEGHHKGKVIIKIVEGE